MASTNHRWVAVAASVLTIPAGFGIAQAVTPDDAGPSEGESGTVEVLRQGDDLAQLVDGVDPAKEGQPFDISRLEMGTPLSECDVALAFFERPDVKAFSEEHFGYSLSAKDFVDGDCPDLAVLQKNYRAAQERVEQGLIP